MIVLLVEERNAVFRNLRKQAETNERKAGTCIERRTGQCIKGLDQLGDRKQKITSLVTRKQTFIIHVTIVMKVDDYFCHVSPSTLMRKSA